MELLHYAESGDRNAYKVIVDKFQFSSHLGKVMDYADCVVVKADCMQLLPLLPAASVALTVTDPPYESLEKHRARGTTTRLKVSKASSNEWYSTFPNDQYGVFFKLVLDVQRPDTHCYVFCDSETEHVILSGKVPFSEKSDPKPLWPWDTLGQAIGVIQERYTTALDVGWHAWPTLTWVKTRRRLKKPDWGWLKSMAEGLWGESAEKLFLRLAEIAEFLIRKGMGYHWSRCTERILFLEKGRRQLKDQKWPDVFFGPRAEKGEHPSKKPANVVRRLILNSSEVGDWVLDPFAGSGVVGEEAVACGRKAILVDVDLKYIEEIEWATGKKVVRLELR